LSAIETFETPTNLDLRLENSFRVFAFVYKMRESNPLQLDYALKLANQVYVGSILMHGEITDNQKNKVCYFEFDHESSGDTLQGAVHPVSIFDSGTCFKTVLAPGTYTFSFTIDANQGIPETDETNNEQQVTFKVSQ
ncbi:MAG: hypothetical protein Q7R47_06365, partial [Candidatus Diapherotrites archaeon]|nr:hypothetical protein [Candidatus Diapherotrites archaeon]